MSTTSLPFRNFIFVIAVGMCTLPVLGLPVHVVFAWPTGMPSAGPASVHIAAIQTAGVSAGAPPHQTEAGLRGAVLNLGEGVWHVQTSTPGYWSEPVEVVVQQQGSATAQLVFWPAAYLQGGVATAGGEPPPESLEIQLTAAPDAAAQKSTQPAPIVGPRRAEFRCPIEKGRWNCLAPAGVFDIELTASAYAPRYEWGVSLKPGETADLGKADLLQTATVFGRIIRKDGSNPPGPCRATLQPGTERRGPGEEDQHDAGTAGAKTNFSVTSNLRGYFQIVGVAPGRYALGVACHGASAFRDLKVQAESETRVDPLLLEELTLEVSILPRIDPSGQPWKLAVYETRPHFLLITSGAPTSVDGHWIRHGLMAGNYHVIVSSSDGTTWLEKYFNFRESSGPLSLRIGSVNVAGRLTMSSQPVRARLVFTRDGGGESRAFMSDERGRFQGLLPFALSAPESTWTVEAHLLQPPVTQRILNVIVRPAAGAASTWLDLDFPAVPVHGTVVSPEGKPQPNIEVIFEGSTGARTSVGTDDAGRFEMLDLAPGKYTAWANSPDGSSDRVAFEMTEGSSREMKLVVNPYKRYSFYVVSNQGAVADAAVQVWTSPGVPRAFVRTDENGQFEVTLPPGTTEVGMTIGAPGYALKLVRLPVSSDPENDSSDARTINLDTNTGTLVLNFRTPGSTPGNSDALYLVHKGAIQDARTIVGWGTNQAGAASDGPATVDAVEPGDYALCRVDPAQVATLWTGSVPSSRCQKGSLEESQTLTLSAP